jgi:hypothetical protein
MAKRLISRKRNSRYLLFADILGTGQLYSSRPPKSDLIEFKRSALGHAVRTAASRYFNKAFHADIQINVFSDTVLIACDNVSVLMQTAASLFHIFCRYSLPARSIDELYLLRGGIAHGEILSSNSITTSKNVVVADIFDTSLGLSYSLQDLRKGSRIFLCDKTYREAVRRSSGICVRWEAITGIGAPIAPAFEFLWTTALLKNGLEFRKLLQNIFSLWLDLFNSRQSWPIKEYDASLYQLDETLKLLIRSAVYSPDQDIRAVLHVLSALLPSENGALAKVDTKYIWGIWFQVLRAILALQETHSLIIAKNKIINLAKANLKIIDGLNYTPTFAHELENPDYTSFKNRLLALGLAV